MKKSLLFSALLMMICFAASSQTITKVIDPTTDSAVTVTVNVIKKFIPPAKPRNQPPICFAGTAQTITLPTNFISLNGTATDPEGKPLIIKWTKVTTLASTIGNDASLSTPITNMEQGTHIFRLTVTDDSAATATSTVNITVNPAPPIDTGSTKAEGFGVSAVGGSNSSVVYHVTNTSSSGAGSLANGLGSNKTIVFDVSGTIIARLDLTNTSYLTIDGSGRDITINGNNSGDAISFDGANTHHCILKNVHATNAGGDGINVIDGAHDILITNCTSYGNRDGNIDIAGDNAGQTKNVTVQWCIIGGGAVGDQSYSGSTLVTAQNVSIHHNLYTPNSPAGKVAERCPYAHCNYSPVGSPNCDFRNNLLYNWGRYATGFGYKVAINVENNYYATNKSGAIDPNADPAGNGSNHANYFVSGNAIAGGADINLGGGNHVEYTINPPYQVTTQDACTAARLVLNKVGPQGASRNATDKNFISAVGSLPGCPVQ